jgi:deazaflavin-dependent oxidoreductase (nitroreductase family)
MKNLWIKSFMAINTFLIRASGGRLASRLGTQTILLLHTTGRRSGKKTVTPIAYFYLDDVFFVVASNWGKDLNAAWYHNLMANPRAGIEVNGKLISVLAREALDDEYARLWKYATEHHPPYLDYQKMTTRRIPIIVLVPIARKG